MKKLGITKRDVLFFFLGILFIIVIQTIYDWPDAKNAFMDGWNGAQTGAKK